MKYQLKTFLLPILVLLHLCSCNTEEANTTVRLKVKAPAYSLQQLEIGIYNTFSHQDNLLVDTLLGEEGIINLDLELADTVTAYYKIGTQGGNLFLAPGYDLSVSIVEDKPNIISFSGNGSTVNNYIYQLDSIERELAGMGEGSIRRLDPEDFMLGLDTLSVAFINLYQQYEDSATINEGLRSSLKKLNGLKLTRQKQNYGLVRISSDPTILEKLQRKTIEQESYGVPLNPEYLRDPLLKAQYSNNLSWSMTLQIVWPIFYDKIKGDQSLMPHLSKWTDEEIRKGQYPEGVEEFLLAKNINDFLKSQGPNSTLDSIFSDFQRSFPSSDYTTFLNNQYDKWMAISPGKTAPDIEGITPEGNNLALSDLKGKVVYVDVWATWCKPCIQEFPHSKKLRKQFEGREEVVFLYVSVDNDEEKWRAFLKNDQDLKGTHINELENESGRSDIYQAYMLSGIPNYMLIDQDGKIVDANAPRPSSGEVQEQIEKLLENNI